MNSTDNLLRILPRLVLFFFGVLAYGFGSTFNTARLVPVGSGPSAVRWAILIATANSTW
jgi:hypothetical protein